MKKILFLINTLGDGGAERVLVDLVNHLDRALFHVTVQTVLDVGVRKKNWLRILNIGPLLEPKIADCGIFARN